MMDAAARLLALFPPETAHALTIWSIKAFSGLLPASAPDDPRLATTALGLSLPSPIGLAAGFDKNAQAPDAMLGLGFGFVECGTITPRPQPGNPKPRLFRLREDLAVINRMGFNNAGAESAARNLSRCRHRGVVGVNIGANKDSADRIGDYAHAFRRLAPFCDYVAINVSSPNTPGLRGLQDRDALSHLLEALTAARAKCGQIRPLLLKIAPDLSAAAMDDIAEAALTAGIEGLIVSNTTIERPAWLRSPHASEAGGLSGAPLFARSTEVLKEMRKRVGTRLALIGVGGVSSGAEAYAKMRAGASLVQLYTALAYEGPGLIGRIKRELAQHLARDGFAHAADAVGADLA
ncbi:MAG TPA: quinone-dependent dihydroorotate dehydrogenase [Rhizomicrobium sp.]|nr:quinone-dependent dihydroorotate dehydrogenase [Rhizomicrobium sp.]